MTHDELLADIDTKILLSEHTIYPIFMQALRAVVELHKPEYVELIQDLGCMACRHGAPCPTIQTIEKELDNAAI
jgi:hypothetical protein